MKVKEAYAMFTLILETATTSLFSGWDFEHYDSLESAMKAFHSVLKRIKLENWTRVYVENERGDTVALWQKTE